jgi:chemotaxis methyl-accepting protein methylase
MSKTPVVGVGASAGGVEDIVEFISMLPKKREYACVILLHSNDEKELSKIISQKNEIFVVQSPVVARAGGIYIAPSGYDLIYENHLIRAVETTRVPKPSIDRFFFDIAYNLKEQCAGILFSGTGNDGVAGLRAIGMYGGATFVKAPEELVFANLVMEAIQAGVVDYVLPTSKIIEKLQVLWKKENLNDIDIEPFAELLTKYSGIDFFAYDSNMLKKRVLQRMRVLGEDDAQIYFKHISLNHTELQNLLARILIHATSFFRDTKAFEALKSFLKELDREKLYIWDAGCATGEESYSLAMMLEEIGKDGVIFGTDVSEKVLQKANLGVYSCSQISEHSSFEKYFNKTGEECEVKENIKKKVHFLYHDITTPPPFCNLDVIVCRNLLIYFSFEARKKILCYFSSALKEGGILFLGMAEMVPDNMDDFEVLDETYKIYRKKEKAKVLEKSYTQNSLDSKKEEIEQSILEINTLNEELETMNEELRYANDELQRSYAKIKTFLENEKKIKRELEKKLFQIEILKEELDKQKEFYKSILDTIPSFVLIVDGGEIKFVNKSFLDFFNLKDEALFKKFIKNNICSLFAKVDLEGFVYKEGCLDNIPEEGAKVAIVKDGEYRYFLVKKNLSSYGTVYVFIDITQIYKKKVFLQESIKDSQKRLGLFNTVLVNFRKYFFDKELVEKINIHIEDSLTNIYKNIIEIAEYCDIEKEHLTSFKKNKDKVVKYIDVLHKKFGKELSGFEIKEVAAILQRLLREIFNTKNVVIDVDISTWFDKKGFLVEVIILTSYIEYRFEKSVNIKITQEDSKVVLYSKAAYYLQNLDIDKNSSKDEELIDRAFILIEILQNIYNAAFENERVILS